LKNKKSGVQGYLKAAQLRLTIDGYRPSQDALTVRFNGAALDHTQWETDDGQIICPDIYAKQGENDITATLGSRSGKPTKPLQIDKLEVLLDYL